MKVGKAKPKKLMEIVIREKSTKKILLGLLPTKSNKTKAANMAVMADIEVIYVYDE